MSGLEDARRELAAYLASSEGSARTEMAGRVLERAQALDGTLRLLANDLRSSDDPGATIARFEAQVTAVEEELHEAHSLYSALRDILERNGLS